MISMYLAGGAASASPVNNLRPNTSPLVKGRIV
jgi:hypothetical protein